MEKKEKHTQDSKHSKKVGFFEWFLQKRIRIVLGLCLAGLCLLYFAGVLLFYNIFMPNTKIDTREVSFQSAAEVAKDLDTHADNYNLYVSGDSFLLNISSGQIDLKLDGLACVQKTITNSNPWTWPVSLFVPHTLELAKEATYNTELAEKIVSDAVGTFNTGAEPPVPAHLNYDATSKSYTIIQAVVGTQLSEPKVQQAVSDSLTQLAQTLVLNETYLLGYQDPSQKNALAQACLEANSMLGLTSTITANGQTLATIGPNELAAWIDVSNAAETSPSFNKELIEKWVNENLASKLNTVGSTRTYTRPNGKVVTVKGGTYGWKADTSQIAEELYENLSQNASATIEVTYSQKGAFLPDAQGVDFPSTYIDVDISEQHAYFFKDGEIIWESDVITGNPSTNHGTPEGVFFVNSNFHKSNPATTLRGKTDPATGKPEYESKVSYWIPFYNNVVGLHDASWQSSFGKNYYLTRGSHGCVNLPVEKAKELVDLVDQGLVVIVHS